MGEGRYSKHSLIHLQLTHMLRNPDQNIINEKFFLQLSTGFKRHIAFSKEDESLVWSYKIWQFLQTCSITFKNKYQFRLQLINKCTVFL
jgi:hypothetical protein